MVSACVLNCLNKDSLVSSCFLGCVIVCFATVIVSLLVKLYTCTRLPLSNSVDRYLQCNKYNKGKRCLFFNFYSSLWWACCPSLPSKHARPIAQKLTVNETCFSAFFSEVFSNLQKLCKNGPLCIFYHHHHRFFKFWYWYYICYVRIIWRCLNLHTGTVSTVLYKTVDLALPAWHAGSFFFANCSF